MCNVCSCAHSPQLVFVALVTQSEHVDVNIKGDEEASSVPSFQDAFNEAFQTASESVIAAQKSNDVWPCLALCSQALVGKTETP